MVIKKQSFLPAGIYNIGCRQNSNILVCVCMDRVKSRSVLSAIWGTGREYLTEAELKPLVDAHDVVAFLFQYPDVETKDKRLINLGISPESIGLIEPDLARRLTYKSTRKDTTYLRYNHLWFGDNLSTGEGIGNGFNFVKSGIVGLDNALIWNSKLACMWTPKKEFSEQHFRCSGESGIIYDDTEVVSILESGSVRHRDVHIGTRVVVEIPSGVCQMTVSDASNGKYSLSTFNYNNSMRAWVLDGEAINTKLIGIRRGVNK